MQAGRKLRAFKELGLVMRTARVDAASLSRRGVACAGTERYALSPSACARPSPTLPGRESGCSESETPE